MSHDSNTYISLPALLRVSHDVVQINGRIVRGRSASSSETDRSVGTAGCVAESSKNPTRLTTQDFLEPWPREQIGARHESMNASATQIPEGIRSSLQINSRRSPAHHEYSASCIDWRRAAAQAQNTIIVGASDFAVDYDAHDTGSGTTPRSSFTGSQRRQPPNPQAQTRAYHPYSRRRAARSTSAGPSTFGGAGSFKNKKRTKRCAGTKKRASSLPPSKRRRLTDKTSDLKSKSGLPSDAESQSDSMSSNSVSSGSESDWVVQAENDEDDANTLTGSDDFTLARDDGSVYLRDDSGDEFDV